MFRNYVSHNMLLPVLGFVVGGLIGCGGWDEQHEARTSHEATKSMPSIADGTAPARLSSEARKNLGLVSKPLQKTSYWRKIEVPGIITDRPGISDRGVVAPVTGIVTKIHAHPGDTVHPESPLFSLRLVSESLHASQLELFKASKEIEIAQQHKQRLEEATESGAIAKSRIVEIDNQIERMQVNVQASRQDLLARGLPPDRVDAAAKGEFMTEITVRAPGEQALKTTEVVLRADRSQKLPFMFEMHNLKVELGQQVNGGEVLCSLADHRALFIEGQAFKKDLPLIQHATRERLPIEVRFEDEEASAWPIAPTGLEIHHVANVSDSQNRTFAFYLALENQWQVYQRDGQDHLLWRFRPGDRVRLSVSVEELRDVFVVPKGAVVAEGPEFYVFRQNGDFFDRRSVHVLHEDSTSVVLAGDGALKPGFFVAQNAAASLNRVLKSQMASGVPSKVHVHADGTVHADH